MTRAKNKDKSDLLQGTLDMLILKTVSLEQMHGWGISQRIQQISRDVLQVNQGSLYPALHRLELQGWIRSSWGASENNRRAKFYEMTAADVASGIPDLVSSVDDPGGDYIAPDPILRPGLVLNVEVTVLDSQGVDAVNRRISPKGEITLPMVGSLQVNGMTRKELIDKLTNAYREFFRFPQIAIQFVVDENDADDY